MAGFRNVRQLVSEQVDNGRVLTTNFRKAPTATTVSGQWYDLSMSPGNPVPNYYASSPLEAATLDSFKGIFHGDDRPGGNKFIKDINIVASNNMRGQNHICDYLLYYPFIDGDSLDEQVMVNDVDLPRYADGDGVLPVLICVAPTTGGGSFKFNYINQDGDAKTSPVNTISVAALNIGSVATSQLATAANASFFCRLADGDTGVREITSFTMTATSGGLFSLVLVKPITIANFYTQTYTHETEFIRMKYPLPEIKNGAYLGIFTHALASMASATVVGTMTTVWSE